MHNLAELGMVSIFSIGDGVCAIRHGQIIFRFYC